MNLLLPMQDDPHFSYRSLDLTECQGNSITVRDRIFIPGTE